MEIARSFFPKRCDIDKEKSMLNFLCMAIRTIVLSRRCFWGVQMLILVPRGLKKIKIQEIKWIVLRASCSYVFALGKVSVQQLSKLLTGLTTGKPKESIFTPLTKTKASRFSHTEPRSCGEIRISYFCRSISTENKNLIYTSHATFSLNTMEYSTFHLYTRPFLHILVSHKKEKM